MFYQDKTTKSRRSFFSSIFYTSANYHWDLCTFIDTSNDIFCYHHWPIEKTIDDMTCYMSSTKYTCHICIYTPGQKSFLLSLSRSFDYTLRRLVSKNSFSIHMLIKWSSAWNYIRWIMDSDGLVNRFTFLKISKADIWK